MSPFLCTHVYLLCDEWENFLLSIFIWCIDMRLRPKKKKKKWHLMVIFHKQTPHVALYAIVFALQVIYYIVTLYSYKFKSWWWHTHTHTHEYNFFPLSSLLECAIKCNEIDSHNQNIYLVLWKKALEALVWCKCCLTINCEYLLRKYRV